MNRLPSSSRQQRGVTLIEALIAFVVLSLGMLAIVRTQPLLRAQADLARQRSQAVRLAQEDIEQLRGLAAAVPAHRTIGADALGSPAYDLVRGIDASTVPHAHQVTTTVSWTAHDGTAHAVALATMIAATDPALGGVLALRR